jgi:hypothetical protein
MNNAMLSDDNPVEMLADLRSKVLSGEEISPEQYAEVLASIRRARTAVPTASRKAGKTSSVSQAEAKALLDDF